MKKAIASILLAALIVLPLAAEDITPTISVSGSAEVSVKPDTAYFSISASFVADTSEEARKLASGTISSAIGILTSEYSVEKEDIVTENLSINPEYKWTDGEQILVGQRASQDLRITITDLDIIGDIYDSLSALNGLTFSSVTLDKADKSAELEEARTKAVLDARTKADTYAEAAGVEVGKVLSISETSSYYPAYKVSNMRLMAADAEASTEYYADDITVSASVSMVFTIE